MTRCFNAHYVEVAAERCLRRQRRDALDVLLLHEPDEDDLRRAHFLATVERLVSRGHVRAWGASVRSAEAAMAALDLPGLTWLQIPVSLADTHVLDKLRAHERFAEVTLVGLAVLGDGALLSRARAALPHLDTADLVATLAVGAADLEGIDAVLLGMSSTRHVRENVTALRRSVPPAAIQELRAALAPGAPS